MVMGAESQSACMMALTIIDEYFDELIIDWVLVQVL